MKPTARIHEIGKRFIGGETSRALALEYKIKPTTLCHALAKAGYRLSAEECRRRRRAGAKKTRASRSEDAQIEAARVREAEAADRAWAGLPSNAFDDAPVPEPVGRMLPPETHVHTQSSAA